MIDLNYCVRDESFWVCDEMRVFEVKYAGVDQQDRHLAWEDNELRQIWGVDCHRTQLAAIKVCIDELQCVIEGSTKRIQEASIKIVTLNQIRRDLESEIEASAFPTPVVDVPMVTP